MPSLVAWLDASSEEQRRVREIVNLFSERESRDELGIGQVRDALSDSLFPGTSTLLTRARYLLLVPWCFTSASGRGRTLEEVSRRVDANERDLIGSLRSSGDTEGLLGRQAGRALKTLPSSLYWGALRQLGILISPTMDRTDAVEAGIATRRDDGEGDEVAGGAWSATLPPVPNGFPANTNGGFDLTRAEAEWLRDRILDGARSSFFAHLAHNRPEQISPTPWSDSASRSAPIENVNTLKHAELFSLAAHGAALVYNLLLAEAYASRGFDAVSGKVEHYVSELAEWELRRAAALDRLARWDQSDFWASILLQNPGVTRQTQTFISQWLALAVTPGSLDWSAHEPARALIRDRERWHKRSQSRLQNTKLLEMWQGASGSRELVFRWPQVRGILTDIHNGLERADA